MNLEHSVDTRLYTCSACEDTVTDFDTKCPSCGGTAFKAMRE